MVEIYHNEDEQLNAIKTWWKDNGNSVFWGIIVAVVAVLGWRFYDTRTQQAGESAALIYQAVAEASQKEATDPNSPEQIKLFQNAKKLMEEYESTSYAQFAALFLARDAVAKKDWPEAEKQLSWVLAHKPKDEIKNIATLRLARVQAAKGDYDSALKTVETVTGAQEKGQVEEIKGDIYKAKGDTQKARAAYQAALDADKLGGMGKPLLQMKLDDLAE
ncbi:MAG TPA: tetratricopeptide repeat protein [Pseudomonadales bacterium]|nr:tetratricopeptide repeat protein [Pseudomonadales bacterium]